MKRTLLLSFLLTAATSFAQDKDQIESTVEGIDAICLNIDSNSQLLLDFMYDHQWAYLYVDNMKSLSKASFTASESGYYFEQTIYLDPECKNITLVHERRGEPYVDVDEYEIGIESETWYYIQDKKIIKKIHLTRPNNTDNEPTEWKKEVSYPLSKEKYTAFEESLSYIIEHTLIKKEAYGCDE